MQKTSKSTMTNRTLFALLVATIVIPLPAMTPALLSGAMGAMTLVASAPPPPQATVPVYFIPTRAGPRPPAMLPETVVLSISDPATVITETGVERSLPFEDLRIPAIVAFEPRMPNPLTLLIGRPGGGSGVTARTPSAVPEPATWAVLIAGFALAGSLIRRRRAAAAAARAV
jgi:hypothetical protein